MKGGAGVIERTGDLDGVGGGANLDGRREHPHRLVAEVMECFQNLFSGTKLLQQPRRSGQADGAQIGTPRHHPALQIHNLYELVQAWKRRRTSAGRHLVDVGGPPGSASTAEASVLKSSSSA